MERHNKLDRVSTAGLRVMDLILAYETLCDEGEMSEELYRSMQRKVSSLAHTPGVTHAVKLMRARLQANVARALQEQVENEMTELPKGLTGRESQLLQFLLANSPHGEIATVQALTKFIYDKDIAEDAITPDKLRFLVANTNVKIKKQGRKIIFEGRGRKSEKREGPVGYRLIRIPC